ncbi:MAG: ABC transporter permease [Myxococcota bacterium]
MRRLSVIVSILFRATWRGFRGSGVTAWVSVVTLAVALFLVGAFALVVVNMEGLLDRFGRDLTVTAYLQDDLSSEHTRRLAETVRSVEVVEELSIVDKDEALERFRQITGGAFLLEGIEENPLPASFEMLLRPEHRNLEGFAILEAALSGLPGIDELRHGREWIDGYARVVSLVRVSGYAVGLVLSLATLLIVANTIRLGVYARRDELEILELVGRVEPSFGRRSCSRAHFKGCWAVSWRPACCGSRFSCCCRRCSTGWPFSWAMPRPVFLILRKSRGSWWGARFWAWWGRWRPSWIGGHDAATAPSPRCKPDESRGRVGAPRRVAGVPRVGPVGLDRPRTPAVACRDRAES